MIIHCDICFDEVMSLNEIKIIDPNTSYKTEINHYSCPNCGRIADHIIKYENETAIEKSTIEYL